MEIALILLFRTRIPHLKDEEAPGGLLAESLLSFDPSISAYLAIGYQGIALTRLPADTALSYRGLVGQRTQ